MASNPFSSARIGAVVKRVEATTRAQIIRLTNELTADNQSKIGGVLGSPAPFIRYVDGSQTKALDQVNPNGFTLTQFELLGHVVDAAIAALIEASPVGPEKGGHYRDDHWLYVNGVRRDATAESRVIEIKPTDEVVIVNMRPYARKIEGGVHERFRRRLTNRRPGLSVQAPDGVYEITARELQRRFGNIARIRFAFHGAAAGRFPALEISARV